MQKIFLLNSSCYYLIKFANKYAKRLCKNQTKNANKKSSNF